MLGKKQQRFRSVLFIVLSSCTLVLTAPELSRGAPIGDLASSMQSGSWAELVTSNINPTLSANGASQMVLGYTEDIVWHAGTRQAFYIGGDHNDLSQFISYTENTNTWQRLPRQSWMGGGNGGAMHGYDHSAINPATGNLYHYPFASGRVVYKYNISSGAWSALPSIPGSDYIACCIGVEYFPELGGLVVVTGTSGNVYLFRESTQQWTLLATGLAMGEYHNFAKYNPVHKVVVFGGGNGNTNLYKLDGSGRITALRNAAIGLGVQTAIFTVDPMSGDYLVFNNNKEFYTYNVLADTWQFQNRSAPIFTNVYGTPVHGVVATPVTTHGVTMFVTCEFTTCKVRLYKHSGGSGPAAPLGPAAPTNLTAK